MTSSAVASDLSAQLLGVLNKFHENNPDLYVAGIDLHNIQDGTFRYMVYGLTLDVRVQVAPTTRPTRKEKE